MARRRRGPNPKYAYRIAAQASYSPSRVTVSHAPVRSSVPPWAAGVAGQNSGQPGLNPGPIPSRPGALPGPSWPGNPSAVAAQARPGLSLQQQAQAQIAAIMNPQIAYYQKLMAQTQAQGEARAKFIANLYQQLGQFQRGIGPAVQGAYAQAGRDQAAFAQGYSGDLRNTAAADAAAVNAELARIGAPTGQNLPGDQGAANVLYALGGAIPGRTLGAQGAAFGSAASFLPSSTAGYGVRQAEYALSESDKLKQAQQMELDKLVSQEPGLVMERLDKLRAQQTEDQRWNAQWRRELANDAYQRQQDALARGDKLAAEKAAAQADWLKFQQARIDAGLAADAKAGAAAVQIDASASRVAGYIIHKDGSVEVGPDGQPVPIYQKPKGSTAKPPKIDRDASKSVGYLVAYNPETGRYEAVPGPNGQPVPWAKYVPPGPSRATAVGKRNNAFRSQTKRANTTARTLAGKGYTRNEAWQALYQEAAKILGGYTTAAGRAGWDKQIRSMVNQALFNAGWRTGKNTTSTKYKPSGSTGPNPFAYSGG